MGGASVIAVVVPAFNEAGGLRTLLPRVPASLLGLPVRVIVVNDGSTDGTGAVALGHGAAVVQLPGHRGKGAALRAGFARALELDPSCLVTMDADGQHDPAYLVRRATIAVLRATLGRAYTDPFCGYRCFSRRALQAIRLDGDRYQSELEALFEAAIHGLEVVEVPVPREYPAGWSRMGASIGGLLGRTWVIVQYASTIARKSRELRRARATALSEVAHRRALAGLRNEEGGTATEERR